MVDVLLYLYYMKIQLKKNKKRVIYVVKLREMPKLNDTSRI